MAHDSDLVEFDALPSNALSGGHCYIQDPSTVIACQLLDPKQTEKILDACAAPRGKTGYIAQLMKNKAAIVACDRDGERSFTLKDNMARLGVGIVSSLRHDWTRGRIPEKVVSVAPFDRILVDAPCSNTGVKRRRVDVRWRLRPGDLTNARRTISDYAFRGRLVKTGRRSCLRHLKRKKMSRWLRAC